MLRACSGDFLKDATSPAVPTLPCPQKDVGAKLWCPLPLCCADFPGSLRPGLWGCRAARSSCPR